MSSNTQLPSVVCEDCYHSLYYGNKSFTKAYKHCILAEAITPEISRKVCNCKEVSRLGGFGKVVSLFPAGRYGNHVSVGSTECNLLKLGEITALAKYNGLRSIVGAKKSEWKPAKLKTKTGTEFPDSISQILDSSQTSVTSGPTADGDVPLFFREFAKECPFGDVHMALRVGPLVIENGVSQ